MKNNLNFQVNFPGNTATPPPAASVALPDPNAPLFASQDGLVASLSNNECIFQVKSSGETHVMTYQVLRALDQCREFRSMDEHVSRVLTTLADPSIPRDGVANVLGSLVERGLMTEDKAFLAGLGQATSRRQEPLRAVFIRACERPDQLQRLMTSLTDYERRFRAGRQYIVLDDSTSPQVINTHRDLLREFARATGCRLIYLGAPEQAKLIERLAAALPRVRDALRQMLTRNGATSRFGGGRGWNLALLLSAGERMALLDDDQTLPLRRNDGVRTGLDPDPSAPAHVRFFRNSEDALAVGEEVADDPFETHLHAAGQNLGVLTTDSRYAIERTSLRGLSLGRLDMLRAYAPVLATMHGTTGSSRTESGTWLYMMDKDSRADFCSDRDSYLRNVEAQNIWYGYQQARVSTVGYFTPFTLDNSAMLPCTNAVGRGEDALFSAVTRLCHPEALVLELPLVIGHLQERPRKRSDTTLMAATPRFNHFVSDFVQRQLPEFQSTDASQRLGLLAAHLRDAAGASQ
ncbi:MAG: hypothetical protein ABI451_01300, partial [Dokdonella sp.]